MARKIELTGLAPASAQSGYVALINVDNVPSELLDTSLITNAGSIRAFANAELTVPLPLHVVKFNASGTVVNREFLARVRFPTYNTTNRSIWLAYGDPAITEQPPVTDPLGQYAVYQDYESFYELAFDDKLTNSAGSGRTLTSNASTFQSIISPWGTEVCSGDGSPFLSDDTPMLFTDNLYVSCWYYLNDNTTDRSIFGDSANLETDENMLGARFDPSGFAEFGSNVAKAIMLGANDESNTSNSFKFQAWGHLALARVGATTAQHWLDGVDQGQFTPPAGDVNPQFMRIFSGAKGNWVGGLGAVSFRSNFPGEGYVGLEYQNQMDPASFWTTGTPMNYEPIDEPTNISSRLARELTESSVSRPLTRSL